MGPVPVLSDESAWAPFRIRIFRALWIAALVSNVGTWMQNVGAAWFMTSLSPSPLMVALIQAATSLPVFIVGLPAGAVADIVDRRRLLLVSQAWMLVAAALLATLAFSGLMTAGLLLALTFALGLGMALNGPTWQAITAEVVPASHLPRAVALNALTVNVGRAIGPALGGVLLALSGPGLVFALNALSFLAVLFVVYRWQRESSHSLLPAERVLGASRAGLRYVRHAPALAAVLVRAGLFMLCGSAFWALLPVVARQHLGLDALGYGVLLACVGLGAVGGAALLPRVRQRLTPDAVVTVASVVFAAVSLATAFWTSVPGLALAMVAGGVGWIGIMASLNGAAQTVVPSWVRARALGVYLIVFQGGLGVGSALWGVVAQHAGAPVALATSAAGIALGLLGMRRWPLNAGATLDLTPSTHWPEPHVDVEPAPGDGPVLVQVEYRIDPATAPAFIGAMRDLEHVRRRDGAVYWAVYRDAGEAGRYVEAFIVDSWGEHLRQHGRGTIADLDVEERVRRLHVAPAPPLVSHWLAARPGRA